MPPKQLILPEADLLLETRRRNQIAHRFTRRTPHQGAYDQDANFSREHPHAIPRNVGPSNTYNCHGLTFGARRGDVKFSDVGLVLEDDDYTEIERAEVLPGDIAVYFSTGKKGTPVGEIEHSGVIVDRISPLNSIKIISKWGYGDERVHFLPDCPYDVGDVRFFRINDCPRLTKRRPFRRGKRNIGG